MSCAHRWEHMSSFAVEKGERCPFSKCIAPTKTGKHVVLRCKACGDFGHAVTERRGGHRPHKVQT